MDIEKQLSALDRDDAEDPNTLYRLKNRYHREGLDTTKIDLLDKLEKKLLAYGNILGLQIQQFEERLSNRVPDRFSPSQLPKAQSTRSNPRQRSQQCIQMALGKTADRQGRIRLDLSSARFHLPRPSKTQLL